MITRTFIRAFTRRIAHSPSLAIPRASLPLHRAPPPFQPRLLTQWHTPRPRLPLSSPRNPLSPRHRTYARYRYRYDPSHAQSAKPLLTTQQIGHFFRSSGFRIGILVIAGSGTYFYISNIEEVPVSGRRRFNCVSDEMIEEQGSMMYKMIMQENQGAILPSWDPRVKMVTRVMKRLIPVSGMETSEWEVHVLNSPEMNAFVIPGGKVFVYSGILNIAKTDDGLAAILGHEIAHNLARHSAESLSRQVWLLPISWLLIFTDNTGWTMGLGRLFGDLLMDFGIMRPASRKQESEADFIGLMMMAKACYTPEAAVGVWQRMEQAQKGQDIPQWLSTHPSNSNRIVTMQQWLPKAEATWEENGCSATAEYSRGFNTAFGKFGGWS